jgi:hypothetical protein
MGNAGGTPSVDVDKERRDGLDTRGGGSEVVLGDGTNAPSNQPTPSQRTLRGPRDVDSPWQAIRGPSITTVDDGQGPMAALPDMPARQRVGLYGQMYASGQISAFDSNGNPVVPAGQTLTFDPSTLSPSDYTVGQALVSNAAALTAADLKQQAVDQINRETHRGWATSSADAQPNPGPGTASIQSTDLVQRARAALDNGLLPTLQFYAANGDREHYWNYLAGQGVTYAQLALGVVRNDSLNGYVANTYADIGAREMGVVLDEKQWNDVGVDLMRRDLDARMRYATSGNDQDLGKVLELPVRDISSYHTATFQDFGFDGKAWTAHVPLASYLNAGNDAGAEKTWSQMMDPNFLRQDFNVAVNDLSQFAKSGDGSRLVWLAQVGSIVTTYPGSSAASFENLNTVEGWSRDNQGSWFQLGSVPGPDGPNQVLISPTADQATMLNRDYAFRLQRAIPMPRFSTDTTPIFPSL